MDTNKERLMKIIDILYHECISAGGDGDALWFSFDDVDDILPLVEEYNSKLVFPMDVKKEGLTIFWGDSQEWITITNDEYIYNNRPGWTQFLIRG